MTQVPYAVTHQYLCSITAAGDTPIRKWPAYCSMLLSNCNQLVNHYCPEVAKEVYVFFLLMQNFVVFVSGSG